MQQDFVTEHKTRYGFIQPELDLIVESITVELIRQMNPPQETIVTRSRPNSEPPTPIETVQMFALDKWHDAKVYKREDLQPGDCIKGAAMIVESISNYYYRTKTGRQQ